MRRLWNWIRTHVWGLLVGVCVMVATTEVHVAGWLAKPDNWVLDALFRRLGSVPADDSIVLIDINDYALERIHAWPWPRALHAELIDTLTELGARAVLMDIVFSEPTPGRIDDPRLDPDFQIDPYGGVLTEGCKIEEAVFDDRLLAKTLQRSGERVYLATFASLSDPGHPAEALRWQAYAFFDRNDDASFATFMAELGHLIDAYVRSLSSGGRQAEGLDAEQLYLRLRLEHLLEKRFDSSLDEATKRLRLPRAELEKWFASAKRKSAKRLVRGFLKAHPDSDWRATFEAIMPGRDIEHGSPDKEDLLRAYRSAMAEHVAFRSAMTVPPSLAGRIRHAEDLTLPIAELAGAANVGLVAFETDAADGVMRRVPLMVEADGNLLKHLGFALSCDYLNIPGDTIRFEDGALTMENASGDRRWRIPLDEEGRTLIDWHIDKNHPEWTGSFHHIPVADVMRIPLSRKHIEDEQTRRAHRLKEFVDLSKPVAVFNEYVTMIRERDNLRRSGTTPDDTARIRQLQQQIESIEQECIKTVMGNASQIQDYLDQQDQQTPVDQKEQRVLDAAAWWNSNSAKGYERNLANIQRDVEMARRDLRPRIKGKICLVGYTATAVADTVNTPVFDEMPGVLAHANVINSMLTGRFPHAASTWFNVGLIVLAGLVVTAVTTWRDPWVSLVCLMLVVGILASVGLWAFYTHDFYMEMFAPMVCVFLTWAFITLYRQLTEERQKRAFSRSLAQYTSPAIAEQLAAQMIDKSRHLDLSPQPRDVTCFFSDLKGFTSISERLGASRTRDVLNPYLEAMSGVLIDHRGFINKFMGDGIFAFFNPPILPVASHARAACEATLRSFDALDELKRRFEGSEIADDIKALSMRVGLNTGEVFVGDYGSGNKLDYTCIGDTVNLAARLEPACKVFGVRSLVSESTLHGAGDGFVARHLGSLQVVGKKEAVGVHELLGRAGEVNGAALEYAEMFGDAVRRFQNRDWDGASRVLDQCGQTRPGDIAIKVLQSNIRVFGESPPPDDWNRGIELTSK